MAAFTCSSMCPSCIPRNAMTRANSEIGASLVDARVALRRSRPVEYRTGSITRNRDRMASTAIAAASSTTPRSSGAGIVMPMPTKKRVTKKSRTTDTWRVISM
jgi:hypothetical protein